MLIPARSIKHCRACGGAVRYQVPADDNRDRAVCTDCGTIHYENPLNVVGTVPVWGERGEQVLLCRRNIEPRRGYWTLPAGFMELGESTAEGAMRETVEEAGADAEIGPLFTVLNVVRVGQVHFFYLAKLRSPEFAPGPETIEAQLFTQDRVPWEDIAFLTTKETLRRYFEDLSKGQFGMHCADIA